MSKFESEKVLKSTIVYSGPNRRRVADTVEFADKSNYERLLQKWGRRLRVGLH
jgi:hypothetical protein